MVLVGYSDSEGSDTEDAPKPVAKPTTKAALQSNFAVDKANPKKIRVNLTESQPSLQTRDDGGREAKRPRIGAGAFSGFNAMLPPPKRDEVSKPTNSAVKPSTRKVFSLKTGAEPAFNRDSDAELRELFAENDQPDMEAETIPSAIPKTRTDAKAMEDVVIPIQGKPLMFKPLSIARGNKNKKKKTASELLPAQSSEQPAPAKKIPQPEELVKKVPEQPRKISLFSSGPSDITTTSNEDASPNEDEDEIIEVLDEESAQSAPSTTFHSSTQTESLTSIADNLNLSAAERRQLFGRRGDATASKVINFNTDTEYAANQAHIAAGEQIQHNPVRAIAPGKHSLKQLVASAQTQKDALEESFASGRRNKREAGSKYGW